MTTTQIVIALTVVILLAYDVYAGLRGGLTNTISWTFVDLTKKYPFISFAFGYLAGHLTSQMF